MISLKISQKERVILTILFSITITITVYTITAYQVASFIHQEKGSPKWPSPGYSFFPWPRTPIGFVTKVTVPLEQTDLNYYNYIINSGVLIMLTILLWILVSWRIWKLIKQNRMP